MKIELLLHFALKVNTCMPQHLYATYCEMFGQRTNNIFFLAWQLNFCSSFYWVNKVIAKYLFILGLYMYS